MLRGCRGLVGLNSCGCLLSGCRGAYRQALLSPPSHGLSLQSAYLTVQGREPPITNITGLHLGFSSSYDLAKHKLAGAILLAFSTRSLG